MEEFEEQCLEERQRRAEGERIRATLPNGTKKHCPHCGGVLPLTRFYWMPLPLPDFFADTAMLTAEERGAFIYIMAAVWRSRDGWIADNDRDLAHFTATGDRWPHVKERLAPLLTFESGRITHKQSGSRG